jgi:hypothetical protein
MPRSVDLTGSAVVDNHCHGFRIDDLLALDADGWEDRLTMMGMCFLSSGQSDERLGRQVTSLRDDTLFAVTARRWLARYFGVEPTSGAVSRARAAAFAADPQSHVARLMADQRIEAVIADDGFPQPTVERAQFEEALGVPVHRVARIEPMIVALQQADLGWSDFEARFEDLLDEAAADPHLVGYKSIIAYRTGLDVRDPSVAAAAAAYDAWRASGWPKDRGPGKIVRDYLLRATLRACRRHDRVYRLLHDHMDQPIILIHGGYPWLAEAAYIASILPFVYLDLSEFLPWASLGADRELEMLLGAVPAGKLLYGSDEASEPEVFWVSARLAREALERVLGAAVERDLLGPEEALRIGRGVLGGNTRRLHGLG